MSNKKSAKKASVLSEETDWEWQAALRLRNALEPKANPMIPKSLPGPYRDGATAGHTLGLLAHLLDGEPLPREILAAVNSLFDKSKPTSFKPSTATLACLLPSPPAATNMCVDLENEVCRQALVKVLFKDVWKMSYDDLREFFRGVAEAIESTPRNLTQAALVNFVYAKHATEIADMVAKGEKIAAIAAFINEHLPQNLRVSAASVKKVIQRHDLPRCRLLGTPKKKRGHS